MRVYLVNPQRIKGSWLDTDYDPQSKHFNEGLFLGEAEIQGEVYSLNTFQKMWNDNDMIIESKNIYIYFKNV